MDRTVMDHLRDRGLTVPVDHQPLLEEYWAKMRRLRADVDEALLADHEIALTYTPVEEQA